MAARTGCWRRGRRAGGQAGGRAGRRAGRQAGRQAGGRAGSSLWGPWELNEPNRRLVARVKSAPPVRGPARHMPPCQMASIILTVVTRVDDLFFTLALCLLWSEAVCVMKGLAAGDIHGCGAAVPAAPAAPRRLIAPEPQIHLVLAGTPASCISYWKTTFQKRLVANSPLAILRSVLSCIPYIAQQLNLSNRACCPRPPVCGAMVVGGLCIVAGELPRPAGCIEHSRQQRVPFIKPRPSLLPAKQYRINARLQSP
jgi:hypothetical protein